MVEISSHLHRRDSAGPGFLEFFDHCSSYTKYYCITHTCFFHKSQDSIIQKLGGCSETWPTTLPLGEEDLRKTHHDGQCLAISLLRKDGFGRFQDLKILLSFQVVTEPDYFASYWEWLRTEIKGRHTVWWMIKGCVNLNVFFRLIPTTALYCYPAWLSPSSQNIQIDSTLWFVNNTNNLQTTVCL